MPVKITSIKIFNEFRNEEVDFLLAGILDKLRIETEFTVYTAAISTTSNPFVARNSNAGLIGDDWLTGKNNPFKGFRIGDTLIYHNRITPFNSGTFTVIDKTNDNAIRLDANFGSVDDSVTTYNFSVTTPITGSRIRWNFVENSASPTFNSIINGAEQLFAGGKTIPLDANDPTQIDLDFQGAKEYWIGNATIEGVGTSVADKIYESKFKVIHYTTLTPFMLANDLNNLIARTAPLYFMNAKCLKFILDIDAAYNYSDPNKIQTQQITSVLGNTGWFNENFNSNLTNYSFTSAGFKKADNATVIESLELITDEQNVSFSILNSVDTPFSNTNTKVVVGFFKLPGDASEYNSTGRTQPQNFCFDRKLITVGSAASDGDNFGTDYQVLKEVQASFLNSGQIDISFKVEFNQNVIDILNESDTPRFAIIATVQDHTLASLVSDRVTLLIATKEPFYDNSDPGLFNMTTKWLRHIENTFEEGQTTISVFPEDEIVAWTRGYINRSTRETDTIALHDVKMKIKAKNTVSDEEFDLDYFELNLDGLTLVPSPVGFPTQYIDFSLNRIFHIPESEIRKAIKVKTRIDLDTDERLYYDFIFPFLNRWEYWEPLISANTTFFDISEPLNGMNQFWHRFGSTSDWKLFFEIIVRVYKNGELIPFSNEKIIISNNYDSNADWEPNGISTYDNATNLLLDDAGTKYIQGYTQTRVEAEFTKVSGTPDLENITVVLRIEPFEKGGIAIQTRLSSMYAQDEDTWYESIDGSFKTKLTLTGDTIKAAAIVDNTQLTNDAAFKITARLYDAGVVVAEQKNFEDDEPFNFEDDEIYQFEDQ